MVEKELTAEQKEFISSLAVDPQFAKNVNKLLEVKNAMLEGMGIEDVKQMYLNEEKENHNQHPRAEPEVAVVETVAPELDENSFAGIETEVQREKRSVSDPISRSESIEQTSMDQKEEIQEEPSQLLLMAQEAVQQLNEVKMKYEIMEEFIHKHILEEKDREISNLQEENKRLKEELLQLQNTIRAAPIKINPSSCDGGGVTKHKKKQKKLRFPCFWKRGCSENYMIRLFSNPKFAAEQIAEIRLGLEADLSEGQIKSYAKHDISARQMREIRMLYEAQNRKKGEE